MQSITAKLPSSDIAPARVDRVAPSAAPVLPLSSMLGASLVAHGAIAFALVALPASSSAAHDLGGTWVSFDLEPLPVITAPEPEPVPEPEALPETPPPVPVARRTPAPPTPIEPEPVPEVAPEVHAAPPSIDDVFGEPPPPAAVMTAEGTGGIAMAQGELGGTPGGTPGGHGTTLGASVRPAAAAAPAGPSDADRRRARRSYVRSLEDLLRGHTSYPRAAAREGLQGRVELALRIGDDGRVIAIRIAESSGHGVLDDAAMDAARELGRVPAPPMIAALTNTDEVRVGVVYVVR
jgi:protein TonB